MAPADLMRVGGKFGEPARYPFAKGMDGFPLVTRIVKEKDERDAFGNNWHTDTMYLEKPPRATLRNEWFNKKDCERCHTSESIARHRRDLGGGRR